MIGRSQLRSLMSVSIIFWIQHFILVNFVHDISKIVITLLRPLSYQWGSVSRSVKIGKQNKLFYAVFFNWFWGEACVTKFLFRRYALLDDFLRFIHDFSCLRKLVIFSKIFRIQHCILKKTHQNICILKVLRRRLDFWRCRLLNWLFRFFRFG